jgi:hypothetical protein
LTNPSPTTKSRVVRLPRESVLHPAFDEVLRSSRRLEQFVRPETLDLEYSVQRLVIDTTPDGRAILQDTNTSAVDFVRALYTVGTLPGSGGL